MKSCIYRIINLINNKSYIGLSRKGLNERKRRHITELRGKRHHNQYLQNAFDKYGEENFIFEILEFVESDFIGEREKFYIEKYKTNLKENGYNLNSGGDEIKFNVDDSTKEKLRKKNIGKILSEDHKRKIGESNKGNIISNEHKKRVSEYMKKLHASGKNKHVLKNLKPHKKGEFKHTEESKHKIGLSRKGKTYEEIFGIEKAKKEREKKSKQTSGSNNPFYKKIDIHLIKKMVDSGVKVKDIANEFDVTRATINNKFKKKYEKTITEYRRDS